MGVIYNFEIWQKLLLTVEVDLLSHVFCLKEAIAPHENKSIYSDRPDECY